MSFCAIKIHLCKYVPAHDHFSAFYRHDAGPRVTRELITHIVNIPQLKKYVAVTKQGTVCVWSHKVPRPRKQFLCNLLVCRLFQGSTRTVIAEFLSA